MVGTRDKDDDDNLAGEENVGVVSEGDEDRNVLEDRYNDDDVLVAKGKDDDDDVEVTDEDGNAVEIKEDAVADGVYDKDEDVKTRDKEFDVVT